MNDATIDPKRRRSARLQMVLVLLVVFSPFIFAQLMFWNPGGVFDSWIPKATKTKGAEILNGEFSFEEAQFPGTLTSGKSVEAYGMWTLMGIVDTPCDAACVDALLYQRQLYLTQGRHFDDLQSVIVFTDANYLPKEGIEFAVDAPMLSVYTLSQAQSQAFKNAWAQWFSEGRDGLVLLDRRSRSAMYFKKNLDPTSARKDLARIMRLNN